MKVFDFDNTLYKGESTFDFAMYVIKRKKSLLKYTPTVLKLLYKYKVCKMDIDAFTKNLEKNAKPFLENQELIQDLVSEFWEENIGKLYPKMLNKIEKEDVVITTSPRFLIEGIRDVLNTNHVLTTEIDLENGKIDYLNFKENKVKSFYKYYGKKKVEELYTDSYNDKPLMEISESVYLVKNGIPKKIK